MRHKSLKIVSIGLVSAMLLVGCGGSSTTTDASSPASTAVAENGAQDSSNKTYGQITAIDGSTITVALGTMKNRGNKQNGGGREDGQTMPSGKPDMPQGSDNANAPQAPTGSDDANKKGNDRSSMIDLTGETKTITVGDSTKISIRSMNESKEGTLSDLQVGNTISFELSDDNNTATTITSQSFGGGGKGGQGGKGNSANTSAAPSATPKAS